MFFLGGWFLSLQLANRRTIKAKTFHLTNTGVCDYHVFVHESHTGENCEEGEGVLYFMLVFYPLTFNRKSH